MSHRHLFPESVRCFDLLILSLDALIIHDPPGVGALKLIVFLAIDPGCSAVVEEVYDERCQGLLNGPLNIYFFSSRVYMLWKVSKLREDHWRYSMSAKISSPAFFETALMDFRDEFTFLK